MAAEYIVELENLHKTYGKGAIEVHALRGVNIQIRPGEYISIMGPSGCGKSTMLNVLGCLDRPTDGRYLLVHNVFESTLSLRDVTTGKELRPLETENFEVSVSTVPAFSPDGRYVVTADDDTIWIGGLENERRF